MCLSPCIEARCSKSKPSWPLQQPEEVGVEQENRLQQGGDEAAAHEGEVEVNDVVVQELPGLGAG